MHIDNKLNWSIHVSHVISRVQKSLYILHRSTSSNMQRRRLLFQAYIYPHFLYGIQLYMFCSNTLRAKLESLFRRCCRIVIRDAVYPHQVTRLSVYSSLNVFPLRLTFQLTSAILLFRILILKQIPSVHSHFHTTEQTMYNARRVPVDAIVLRIPRVSSERAKHNFMYWGAVLWNSIPMDIRRLTSLIAFKNSYVFYLNSKLPEALEDNYDLLNFL